MGDLKEYVAKLDSDAEAERVYAAEDIGYLNDPDGVPALMARLSKESSVAVRDAIFQALIRTDGLAPIESSIELLGSGDPQIRNQAVEVLRRKTPQSIPLLKTVMENGDKHRRKLVLDVLSGVDAPGAQEIYWAALSDEDANVVITAVENLGRLREVAFRSKIEDLLQTGSHPMLVAACLEALAGIGNETSLKAIRATFPDVARLPDFLVTPWLKAVAAMGLAREFDEVAGLLPLRRPHLRPAILSALREIQMRCRVPQPDENLLSALRAVVEDGDPSLCRYQAVQVLGSWADRDDVSAFLAACLSNTDRLVRLGAAETLRAANRTSLDPVLAARAIEEPDEEVIRALGC